MNDPKIPRLDPTIHSAVRLAVLSILISVREAEFTYLKEQTGATDGNLSTHLTRLEEKKLIRIKKAFKGKRPVTTCQLTEKGREAFQTYVKKLESIINKVK